MSEHRYVAMFGSGLGAVTEINGGTRRIVWDQHVKRLRNEVAEILLRSTQFLEAVPMRESPERFGLATDVVGGLVESGKVRLVAHTAPGGDLLPVLVLDDETRRALAAAAPTHCEGVTP